MRRLHHRIWQSRGTLKDCPIITQLVLLFPSIVYRAFDSRGRLEFVEKLKKLLIFTMSGSRSAEGKVLSIDCGDPETYGYLG